MLIALLLASLLANAPLANVCDADCGLMRHQRAGATPVPSAVPNCHAHTPATPEEPLKPVPGRSKGCGHDHSLSAALPSAAAAVALADNARGVHGARGIALIALTHSCVLGMVAWGTLVPLGPTLAAANPSHASIVPLRI